VRKSAREAYGNNLIARRKRAISNGMQASAFKIGNRVGIGRGYSSLGKCNFCLKGTGNLCPDFMATGRDAN